MTQDALGAILDRVKEGREVEHVAAKTYKDILQDAECLKGEDLAGAKGVIRDAVTSNLDKVEIGAIIRAIKKYTGIPLSDLRAFENDLRRGGGNTTPEDLGRLICKRTLDTFFGGGQLIVRVAGDYWTFSDTHWSRRTDDQILYYINQVILNTPLIEGASHSSVLSQAAAIMRAVCSPPDDVFSFMRDPLPIINCKNGELWLSPQGDVEMRPHNPQSYQTHCLDVEFDPHATCPMFDTAIAEIFSASPESDEMVRHFMEFFGYAIQPVRDIPSWWLLKGMGQNGKTKLMETVMRLMGKESYAAVRVGELGDRFVGSVLLGKLMVIDDDVDKNTHLPDGILKSISERKVMQAEFKGRDRFNFICNALPVMLCNGFPSTSDLSFGMRRRANVIPFKRQFSPEEVDRGLFPRIWANELPGILNRALQGLQRLRVRGGFAPPGDCQSALDIWYRAANPLLTFIHQNYAPDPSGKGVKWSDVHPEYRQWAEKEGLRFVLGRNSFKREFVSLGMVIKPDEHGYPRWKFHRSLSELEKAHHIGAEE